LRAVTWATARSFNAFSNADQSTLSQQAKSDEAGEDSQSQGTGPDHYRDRLRRPLASAVGAALDRAAQLLH